MVRWHACPGRLQQRQAPPSGRGSQHLSFTVGKAYGMLAAVIAARPPLSLRGSIWPSKAL
eukprot:8829407-Alexandrium_andersonii.AAC.1